MSNVDDYKGKAIELAGGVEYAAGSVVSKTILDKKTGTLTLFAFDEGQGLSEHTSPYDATVQIVDGVAELVVVTGRELQVVRLGQANEFFRIAGV